MIEYCQRHNKKHDWSDWRGKMVETKTGWKMQYICLEYAQSHYPEFIPQSLKNDRVTYANDMLQSTRGGELSREFLEAHPQRAKQMLRDGAITKEDVKKSKYVWRMDVPGVSKKIDAEILAK